MVILSTFLVNPLLSFLSKGDERHKVFLVRLDHWIKKSDNHPEIRLVVLESLEGERYAVSFPQEVALLEKVTFSSSGGKAQIRSEFLPADSRFVKFQSVSCIGKWNQDLMVRHYLLYEQSENGRWELIECDGVKILR